MVTVKLYGYDIDGVVTKGVTKVSPYVIISGRTFSEYDELAKELAQHAPVYIRGIGDFGNRTEAGNFKAHMINLLQVTEFYEDDEFQAAIIEKHCHNCKVIIVK